MCRTVSGVCAASPPLGTDAVGPGDGGGLVPEAEVTVDRLHVLSTVSDVRRRIMLCIYSITHIMKDSTDTHVCTLPRKYRRRHRDRTRAVLA